MHRTGRNAAPAAQTVGLDGQHGRTGRERQDAGRPLDHGNVQGAHGNAHHGASGQDLHRILRKAARGLDELPNRGPQRDLQVLGVGDHVAGDRDDTVHDGDPLCEGKPDVIERPDVQDDAAHVRGKGSGRDLLARDGPDQHLLRALRVLDRVGHHADARAVVFGQLAAKPFNAPGLVLLDGYDALRVGEEL